MTDCLHELDPATFEDATPTTRRDAVVDVLHGEAVADPYRWLEDTESAATRAWIDAQNALTAQFLDGLWQHAEIESRLTELWDYPKHGLPFRRGDRWFQTRNSGLQDQSVLYVMASPLDEGQVLLDANLLSEDGTVALSGMALTPDGSRLAYATSVGGSDWMTWRVRDVASGVDSDDVVEWSKYGSAAFLKDGSGFYYNRLESPEAGRELLERTARPRVFIHRLGTPQEADELVFELRDDELMPSAHVTFDGRFLVVTVSRGTFPESDIHVLDLERPDTGWHTLVGGLDVRAHVVGNVGDDFFVLTDHDAPRCRLVRVALARPERSAWTEVVPERTDILTSVTDAGGFFVCHYLRDAQARVEVIAHDGSSTRTLDVPPVSSVSVSGRPDDAVIHLSTTSFVDAGSLWSCELRTGAMSLLRRPAVDFDVDGVVATQVFVPSLDGTLVPVFLVHRREIEPTGDVRVLLTGYGGFNVSLTPAFAVSQALWVERGGLLAVANLRGGGEYGQEWYEAGRLANKQNVFDDFCSVAEWLVTSGWTSPERIGIRGGSNGGLLVGACMTQRPELFGAAVPEVGVLDMLRFHKFTIGWAWTSDYGNPGDPEHFEWLRAYSPLHNVRDGVAYPSTLVTTGDRDDRVVPGHSFKFAAALQHAQGGPAPVLIRVETSAGHGAGKPTSKSIRERADVLAFLEWALSGPRRRRHRRDG